MARLSNRLMSTMVACVAILLLVILLVVLWTGGWYGKGIENNEEEIGVRSDVNSNEQRANFSNNMVLFQKSVNPFLSSSLPAVDPHSTVFEKVTTTTNEVPVVEKMERRKDNGSLPDVLPSAKGDLEYIMPMKISQNQYEDPLDPLKLGKRHHSGHFRHSTAKIWDPHPQYEFTAFGRFFRLRLAHDSSFISPDIKVTHINANTSRRVHPGHQLDCFYNGFVDGDPRSIVTVNLCHGMCRSYVEFHDSACPLVALHSNWTLAMVTLEQVSGLSWLRESWPSSLRNPSNAARVGLPVSFNQNFLLLKFPSKSTSQPPSDLDT